MRRLDWRWVIRRFLALLWIGNGLEKFGVAWPLWFRGGTGDVAGMLGIMADTPILPLGWTIQKLLLPLGDGLTLPVGLMEVFLGLSFLTGSGLRWSGVVGALMQTFFWAGFIASDWPFQYPLLIVAHLALAIPAWVVDRPWGAPSRWLGLMLGLMSLMWFYEGWTRSSLGLVAGMVLALGLAPNLRWHRGATVTGLALGLVLTILAFRTGSWGNFVWAYYTVAALQVSALVAQYERG